jgi:hypothetical protein
MNQWRDREQLERKLDLCRRLSVAASDPTTSIGLAQLIEELSLVLRESEWWSEHPVQDVAKPSADSIISCGLRIFRLESCH